MLPNNRPMWFNREAEPIDAAEFERLLTENPNYRRIELTSILDTANPDTHIHVSTVWLGVNYNFLSDGPPLIFETLPFAEKTTLDQMCTRYATEQQAREGHARIVAELAETCTDPVLLEHTDTVETPNNGE